MLIQLLNKSSITLPVMSANVFIQLNNCVIAAFERKLQKLTKTNCKCTLNDIEHKTCWMAPGHSIDVHS